MDLFGSLQKELQKQSEELSREYEQCAEAAAASTPQHTPAGSSGSSRGGDGDFLGSLGLGGFSPAAFTTEALSSVSKTLSDMPRLDGGDRRPCGALI